MRKKTRDRHLPARLYFKNGAYWYVHKNKWTRLSDIYTEALQKYASLVSPKSNENAMAALIDKAIEYHAPTVAQSTIVQYRCSAKTLKEILAEFEPHQVKPKHIAAIKANYRNNPGTANRYISILKVVFRYAMEWGIVEMNPCVGIGRLKEGRRDRYITDKEFMAIKHEATPLVSAMMDLCYLTGQRIGDVLAIKLSDISADHIQFKQQKTGKELKVIITPDLKVAIDNAKRLQTTVRGFHLLTGRGGKPIKYLRISEQWRKACKNAGIENANIHDLRRKSLTDTKRQGHNPRLLAGHTDERMTDSYIVDREIDVAEGPSMVQSIRQALDN